MPLNVTFYRCKNEPNVWANLDKIETMLQDLANKGKLNCNIVDTDTMPEPELADAYIRAIMPSVWKKYRVRTVFGSNRHSGVFFGKQQPALLVEGEQWDIYPHEKDEKRVLIETFLQDL